MGCLGSLELFVLDWLRIAKLYNCWPFGYYLGAFDSGPGGAIYLLLRKFDKSVYYLLDSPRSALSLVSGEELLFAHIVKNGEELPALRSSPFLRSYDT